MSVKSNDIDQQVLGDYLETNVDGFSNLTSLDKFDVGQSNPTFLVHADSGKYVLRRQPPGKLLKSAHAVDREYRVMSALAQTDVPVPEMYHLCTDTNVIGSMFYLMEFADGRMLTDPNLPDIELDDRHHYYTSSIETLAAIHSVDLEKVGLDDYGRGSNFFEWQIGLWIKQYRAAETELRDDIETLIEWLPKNLPEDDGQITLIHGDYKFDNLMFNKTKSKVLVTLDWELSTLGHPISDLAYFCMCLRMPALGFMTGLGGIDRSAIGVPSEKEFVDQYCKLRGMGGINNWNFYLAFSFFRLASISQGVYKRSQQGNASGEHAVLAGKVTEVLAEHGVKLTR